jgi:glycosyltransferase A (GT-A) superfamily protein (DUF2064 family)
MTASTALLLFTRTASQEAAAKQFVFSNKVKSEKISQKLINHSLGQIKKSGLPYFIISSAQQHGNSFGERLANAIEEIFSSGYQNVIAIGNDSPQVTSQLLTHAATEMSLADLVLGPDKRGGIYLLGISKKAYSRNELLNFRWNSTELFNDFIKWKNKYNLVFSILPGLKDLNGETDLQSLLRQKSIALNLLHYFLAIIASSTIATIQEIIFLKNLSTQNSISRRGPPPYTFAF